MFAESGLAELLSNAHSARLVPGKRLVDRKLKGCL